MKISLLFVTKLLRLSFDYKTEKPLCGSEHGILCIHASVANVGVS